MARSSEPSQAKTPKRRTWLWVLLIVLLLVPCVGGTLMTCGYLFLAASPASFEPDDAPQPVPPVQSSVLPSLPAPGLDADYARQSGLDATIVDRINALAAQAYDRYLDEVRRYSTVEVREGRLVLTVGAFGDANYEGNYYRYQVSIPLEEKLRKFLDPQHAELIRHQLGMDRFILGGKKPLQLTFYQQDDGRPQKRIVEHSHANGKIRNLEGTTLPVEYDRPYRIALELLDPSSDYEPFPEYR